MLESITIHQIALIDHTTIHFHEGMQVLTGETGAGKSIVVDSVNLILGGRADRDLIRSGCEKASVEAVFNTRGNQKIRSFLESENIEYDGEIVTIYREFSISGKNICRICGILLPVSRLREIASILLDIHGQNEHQFLNDPEKQLSFLDQTGNKKHYDLMARVKSSYECFIQNHRIYGQLVRKNENREQRMFFLEKNIEELQKAGIQPAEKRQLQKKRNTLADSEKKVRLLKRIHDDIFAEEHGFSALSRIKDASDMLKSFPVPDNNLHELSKQCETAYFDLEEIAYQISVMIEKEDFDPELFQETDDRLEQIHRFEHKYGCDAEQLPDLLKSMEEEYRNLSDLEEQLSQMSAEHKHLLSVYRNNARELSSSRMKLASEFENRIIRELKDLGMENTKFKVAFIPNDTGRPIMPTASGDDHVEFMISPNPGEPIKPLVKIASGGELSRIMLALKTMESAHTGVDAMVFDEIDTGISGHMAQAVAEKMIAISRARQVICVTHLPQIAAAADFHYLVQKKTNAERTNTSVFELDQKGRIAEVSRMISGADGITDESNSYASRMIQAAKEMKKT